MPYVVGWIVTALLAVFKNRIGQIILAALAWAGLTWGTQTLVIQPSLDAMWAYLSTLTSLGGQYGAFILNGMGLLKVDIALSMIVSSVNTKIALGAAKTFLQPKAVGGGTGY